MKAGNPHKNGVNRRRAKALAISRARQIEARTALITVSAILISLLLLGAGRLVGP